jgi:hypothetical protein
LTIFFPFQGRTIRLSRLRLLGGFIRVRFTREPVRDNEPANLLDLIGFGLATTGLEIQDFRHAIPSVDVVIAPDPLDEAQMEQSSRVRRSSKRMFASDAIQDFRDLAHDAISDVIRDDSCRIMTKPLGTPRRHDASMSSPLYHRDRTYPSHPPLDISLVFVDRHVLGGVPNGIDLTRPNRP